MVKEQLTPEQMTEHLLREMSNEQLKCRGQHRHRWPSDEIGPDDTVVPRGMQTTVRNGMYTITEPCMRGCGRWRRFTTLTGCIFDLDTTYSYWSTADSDWVIVKDEYGVTITGRQYKREQFRRSAKLIQKSAVKLPDEQ